MAERTDANLRRGKTACGDSPRTGRKQAQRGTGAGQGKAKRPARFDNVQHVQRYITLDAKRRFATAFLLYQSQSERLARCAWRQGVGDELLPLSRVGAKCIAQCHCQPCHAGLSARAGFADATVVCSHSRPHATRIDFGSNLEFLTVTQLVQQPHQGARARGSTRGGQRQRFRPVRGRGIDSKQLVCQLGIAWTESNGESEIRNTILSVVSMLVQCYTYALSNA